MKYVPIVLGHRKPCYHCGDMIRTAILPQIDSARWQVCEDFDGTPEFIQLHDCPRWPSRSADAAVSLNGGRRG